MLFKIVRRFKDIEEVLIVFLEVAFEPAFCQEQIDSLS